MIPYRKESFNDLQKVELNSLSLSLSNVFLLSILGQSDNDFINYLLMFYILIANSIFFIIWSKNYFETLRKNFLALNLFIKSFLNNCFKNKVQKGITKQSIFRRDYEELYNEILEKYKEKKIENKNLMDLNKKFIEIIKKLESKIQVIAEEDKVFPFKDLIPNKRTKKESMNSKFNFEINKDLSNKQINLDKFLNPEPVTIKLKGRNFKDHFLNLKFELLQDIWIEIKEIIIHDKGRFDFFSV